MFTSKTDFGTGGVPHSVAIGDLNADGKPDLAVTNEVSVSVLFNLGPGIPTSIVPTGGTPRRLALDAVYPNPSHSIGRDPSVRFVLPVLAPAQLELFDVAGRRVVGRDVGGLGIGEHTVSLARETRIRPGLYFVRLRQRANMKMTRVTVLD